MGSATIRDVARHAAVSVASVSRALNGHSNVHPDTRERVLAAAMTLGYVPHAGARSLSMARSHAIGVVLPDLHGEFFSEIVRGMDRAASAAGYHLLVSTMHAEAELAAQAMRSMRGRVDGLIVMAPQLDRQALDEALPSNIPAVLINSPVGGDRPALRVDNRAGIDALVRHLVDSGRRALVHIAGPAANIDAAERRDAFTQALARYAPGAPLRVIEGTFREESGIAAIAALRASATPFDAIVAGNDMMALGAWQALKEAGVDVPHAVALAGFDDIPLARFVSLTTVRVALDDMGARAVARLLAALDGGAEERGTELVTPTLVVRGTSATLV